MAHWITRGLFQSVLNIYKKKTRLLKIDYQIQPFSPLETNGLYIRANWDIIKLLQKNITVQQTNGEEWGWFILIKSELENSDDARTTVRPFTVIKLLFLPSSVDHMTAY